jgi:lipopolysaccharide exporter
MKNESSSTVVKALLVLGVRWIDRLIGLVSTIILARLLAPEDFGIVAMAMLVVGLIDVMLDFGVNITLVQNNQASQKDYDAAWTLRIVQSFIVAIALYFLSGPASAYFGNEKVAPVIQVLAVVVFISGLENIGIVSYQKNLQFGQEFKLFLIKRLSGFAITLVAAWLLQSYWALVIGTAATRVASVISSYAMHEMRPRLNWLHIKSLLSFSTWNLLRSIGGYLGENLHRLLVGNRESTKIMGAYTLSAEISAIPSTELLAPLNRMLFPIMVMVKDDAAKLKRVFFLAMGLQAMIGIPAAVGLAMIAKELVFLMLGDKWAPVIPFIQLMGFINIVAALNASPVYLFLTLGEAKMSALHSWFQVILLLAVVVLVVPGAGAMEISAIRLAVALVGLLLLMYFVFRAFPTWSILDVLASIWRPVAASAAMAAALMLLPDLSGLHIGLQVLLKVVVGAGVYGICLMGLWLCVGRRDGAETYVLQKIGLINA